LEAGVDLAQTAVQSAAPHSWQPLVTMIAFGVVVILQVGGHFAAQKREQTREESQNRRADALQTKLLSMVDGALGRAASVSREEFEALSHKIDQRLAAVETSTAAGLKAVRAELQKCQCANCHPDHPLAAVPDTDGDAVSPAIRRKVRA
jgi:hypothetical protein